MSRIQTVAAAELLGINPRTVQGLAAQGLLPGAAKIGKVWTFDRAKLVRHIAAKEAETEARACQIQKKTSTSAAESGGCAPRSAAQSSAKALEHARSKLRAACATSGWTR